MAQLEQHLSPIDFRRMQEWISGLPDSERSEIMAFIMDRETRAPEVGQVAPDFELAQLGSHERVRLSAFAGVRPVALIFGSYT